MKKVFNTAHQRGPDGISGSPAWRIIETTFTSDGPRSRVCDGAWHSAEEAHKVLREKEAFYNEELRHASIDAWRSALQPVGDLLRDIRDKDELSISDFDRGRQYWSFQIAARKAIDILQNLVNPQPPAPVMKPWTPPAAKPAKSDEETFVAFADLSKPRVAYSNVEIANWPIPEGWRLTSCCFNQLTGKWHVTLTNELNRHDVKAQGETLWKAMDKVLKAVREL